MPRSVSSFVLSVLVIYTALISGCAVGSDSETVRLAGSDSNARPESTPSDLEFPRANGFVNDFAGILTAEEVGNLESGLREMQQQGKIDFAIAIVKSANGKDIFDYSLGMAEEWKIGSENGGALLVVAIDDRKWRVQIDKKLEKKFKNDEIKTIGHTMIQHFREQKYNDGIRACVKAFMDELARRHNFEKIELY